MKKSDSKIIQKITDLILFYKKFVFFILKVKMEDDDIRKEVLSKIDKDIKELASVCSIDKLSQKICSNLSFWKPIFDQYELNFPKIKYTTFSGWISCFEIENKLKFNAYKLTSLISDTTNEVYKHGFYINGNNDWLEIFNNIEGIDISIISHILNVYRILLLSEKEIYAENIPTSELFYDEEKKLYNLSINCYSSNSEIKIYIDFNTANKIIYRILSTGTKIHFFENDDVIFMRSYFEYL